MNKVKSRLSGLRRKQPRPQPPNYLALRSVVAKIWMFIISCCLLYFISLPRSFMTILHLIYCNFALCLSVNSTYSCVLHVGWLFSPQLSLVPNDGLLNPDIHDTHVCVHAVLVRMCACVTPGNYSGQVPEPLVLTGKRSATIELTCVHSAFLKTGAEGPAVDGSFVGLLVVADIQGDQFDFGLSQHVWFGPFPLGVAPAADVTLFSRLKSAPATWQHADRRDEVVQYRG